MRESRASTQDIAFNLTRTSALIGNGGSIPDVALHHDASVRPVINTGVICWVELRTPGGAHTFPILSASNRHFKSRS
eukprot:1767452-Pyramimonas_sp.AAC.1